MEYLFLQFDSKITIPAVPGVYIHIPFCKQACTYCNFHFTTSLSKKDDVIQAIGKEITLQRQFEKGKEITSIYLGGGSPSLLSDYNIQFLFEKLGQFFTWKQDIEITLEANPDDISADMCQSWKNAGINRLSLGIQSFWDHHLAFMRRAHDSQQAKNSIFIAQDAGFTNLTCDLIFGIPGSTTEELAEDLTFLTKASIPHISAYALTLEEKTIWHKQVKAGISPKPDEELTEIQFYQVMEFLLNLGYEQYEISNYALPGHEAFHNTRYWQGDDYLGLGPSAHSYTGDIRRWNIPNNSLYLAGINTGMLAFEEEILSKVDAYNEYVMIGLRTKWGVKKEKILSMGSVFADHFNKKIEIWIQNGHVQNLGNCWILTRKGKIFADTIASDLFYT